MDRLRGEPLLYPRVYTKKIFSILSITPPVSYLSNRHCFSKTNLHVAITNNQYSQRTMGYMSHFIILTFGTHRKKGKRFT